MDMEPKVTGPFEFDWGWGLLFLPCSYYIGAVLLFFLFYLFYGVFNLFGSLL